MRYTYLHLLYLLLTLQTTVDHRKRSESSACLNPKNNLCGSLLIRWWQIKRLLPINVTEFYTFVDGAKTTTDLRV